MPTSAPHDTAIAVSTVLVAPSAAAAARIAAAGAVGAPVPGRRRAPTTVGAWIVQQGVYAIEAGGRIAIPAPPAEVVTWFIEWGNFLNENVRSRWIDPHADVDLVAAVSGVGEAAATLASHVPEGPRAGRHEPRSVLVKFRADSRILEAFKVAAGASGVSLGAWVRDAVDGQLGRHWDRPPAETTRDARRAAGRIAGLLAQADQVAVGPAELAVIETATDQLADLQDRLAALGVVR